MYEGFFFIAIFRVMEEVEEIAKFCSLFRFVN